MALPIVEIYVPCDTLTVNVKVGPGDSLSPLEEEFLRAVDANVTAFDDLARVFGLSRRRRLLLDLTFELWQRGYVAVDLGAAEVRATPVVKRAIAEDRLADLDSAESRDESQKVVQELLTGYVLPFSRTAPARISPRTVAPVDGIDIGLGQLSEGALLAALREGVVKEHHEIRDVKILEANLAESNLRRDGDRRWLALRLRPILDPDTDRMSFELVDSQLPLAVHRLMAERISHIVDDRPELPFSTNLRASARSDRPLQMDIRDALERLERDVRELSNMKRVEQEAHHDRLTARADEIEAWCWERIANEITARLVVGSDHHRATEELVEGAKRQLVIASMDVREATWRTLLPRLRAALDRNVQIFVLWGIDRTAELDSAAAKALTQLKYEFPYHFYFSEQSSRTHAKFVIQDNARVLLTSRNLLSGGRTATFELGVEFSASDLAKPSDTIEKLLSVAQSRYPDYLDAQLMLTRASSFADPGHAAELMQADGTLVRPRSPAQPIGAGSDLDAAISKTWEIAWTRHAEGLRALRERAQGLAAALIRDGQHRDMLWSAIRSARNRLVICSDQLGVEVVDDRFLGALEERLTEGLDVLLVWQRLSRGASGLSPNPEDRLVELASRHPRLRLGGPTGSHAKLLVADDTALITSFNFLSLQGFYDQGVQGKRRLRSQVGVQVTGGDFADEVVAAIADRFALDDEFPRTLKTRAEHSAEPAAPEAPGEDATGVLLMLAEAPDGRARAECLSKAFSESLSPGQLLQDLMDASLPEEQLRAAVASWLLLTPSTGDADRAEALAWLAASSWRARDFVEAALLRSAAGSGEFSGVPGAAVVRAFACLGTAHFGDAATEAMESERDADHSCLAIAGALALALHGDQTGTALMDLNGALPSSWSDLMATVARLWTSTYAPLPLERIQVEVDATRHESDVEEAWLELIGALETGEQKAFAFASGKRMRGLLYSDSGALGRLRTSARARDAVALKAWLAEHRDVSVDEFLDSATIEATGREDQLLRAGTRSDFVRRLEAIFLAVERVLRTIRVTSEHVSSDRLRAVAEIAVLVRERWDELANADQPEPVNTAIEFGLSKLSVLRDWRP